MRLVSLATSLVLAGIVSTPAVAGTNPFSFFADGAGAIEIEGDGEVPLLRGVDTDSRPAVLAQGEDKEEPDEFLLHVRMLSGANHCTEAVATALGGEIEEFTLAKSKKDGALSATVKTVTKGAVIPELRLKGENGQVVIKDWHCEIHAKDNALSVASLREVAVAQLADRGVYAFAKPEMADKLLAKVGTPVETTRITGGTGFDNGVRYATVGTNLVVDGELFGQPAKFVLSNGGKPTRISGPYVTPPHTAQVGGVMRAIGSVSLGGVELGKGLTFDVYDTPVAEVIGETEADDLIVHAELAAADYADLSIAVDPSTGRVAFKKVEAAAWTDTAEKFIGEAKKAYDKAGGKSASLLVPATGTLLAAVETAPSCDPYRVVDNSFQTVDGVRAFGAAAQRFEPNECAVETRVERAEEGGDAPDESDGTESGSVDKKEAQRLADYADVLWKHGRFAEAFDLYDQAQAKAGEDCSYFEDFAVKAMVMGETDKAIEAAKRSAELYEPWAAQDVEIRIAVERGDDKLPDGAVTKAQSHTCHKARGYEAMAYLAKGSHKRVEMTHAEHMDLDEQVPMALALSRLQRGQTSRARGPALEALNVGARGTTIGHLVHGVAASRAGSERLLDANLDRILALGADLRAGEFLVGSAMARESSDANKVVAFLDRAITDRPGSAGAWTAYGLDARRRGDAGALAKVEAVAAEIAQDEIDSSAGLAWSYCEAASLLYVAGDSAAADAFRKKAEGQAKPGASCLVTDVVRSAVSGDAQASENALAALAVRHPLHPLGTLSLVSAVTATAQK